jgi:acyl carrier protein
VNKNALSEEAIRKTVASAVQAVLGHDIGGDEPLLDAGLDSMSAVELQTMLERSLGVELPGTLVFDYPSVDAVVSHLNGLVGNAEEQDVVVGGSTAQGRVGSDPDPGVVFIDGFAARTAGSGDGSGDGDGVCCVPFERWDCERVGELAGGAWLPRFGAFMRGVDVFDASAFGTPFSAAEAQCMDPQQRLILEGVSSVLVFSSPLLADPLRRRCLGGHCRNRVRLGRCIASLATSWRKLPPAGPQVLRAAGCHTRSAWAGRVCPWTRHARRRW